MFKTPNIYRGHVNYYHDVIIKPAIFGTKVPVEISFFQCAEPMPYAQAIQQKFVPGKVDMRFGPGWSTIWFHLTGTVPPEMAGQKVVLRFRSATEALVYKNGVPDQGMEVNHDDYPLVNPAKGGEKVDLYVECGVNTYWGAGGAARGDSREPINSLDHPGDSKLKGHLHTCDLAVLNPEVQALYWDVLFLRNLENKLPEKSPRKRQILHALNEAFRVIEIDDVVGTAAAARAILEPVIHTPTAGSSSACYSVGQAHTDTAWLWPLRETVRKCSRTFSTQCMLMDDYPDYVFQASQAQQYAYIKEHFPELYTKIKERVKRGQWEASGGMWVEADCNIPNGESLVRQIVHGIHFFEEEFGAKYAPQNYLWLPDVFGYSAALPQILKQAGLEYFITQKISWNQHNKFPHHTFNWQGIDGTQILSHFLPADTYTATNLPEEQIHGQENNQDVDRANMYLNAFGFGDGGGGPTRQHIELVHRSADSDPLPKMQCSRVDHFLKVLEQEATDLQVWVGELYLEMHRGTYTSQAHNKQANRESEILLHDAELLATLQPQAGVHGGGLAAYPAAMFDASWKLVLLNQFHDIIPGSSIKWVYEDSQDQYAQVKKDITGILNQAAETWISQIDTSGLRNPVVVFNTLSWDESDLITIPLTTLTLGGRAAVPGSLRDALGRVVSPVQKISLPGADGTTTEALLARAVEVPPLGYAVFDLATETTPLAPTEAVVGAVTGGTAILENRLLRVELDAGGRITRLFDKLAQRELVDAAQPANQLMLYEDRPNGWPAWDIDIHYMEKASPLDTPAELKLAESGPLRASIEVSRAVGKASRLTQRIQLAAESMRVDFVTHVEWQEDQTLLRVLHPLQILSPRATYEIQFGNVERPTHFNTSWDVARFEVCAQKWADLSEPGYGVALLNATKQGYSCHGHVLGLSLLRAPIEPDPKADRGTHDFTYALLPHAGDWRGMPGGGGGARHGVLQQAHRLNTPLRAVTTASHKAGGQQAGQPILRASMCSCDQPNVIIDTVKKAEKSAAIILRLYEAYGQRGPARVNINLPFKKAVAVDLLERPTKLYDLRVNGRSIELDFTPFAIRTILLEV